MPKLISSILLISFITISSILIQSCGSGGGCDGTTFVNESTTDSVTVSASSVSEIFFSTFILEPLEENKVCGNDVDGIIGEYEWTDGDTAELGLTWSGGNFCIYLTSVHTATSGNCI